MSSPYLIEGPAQFSFSGGRSSGMALCRTIEAHGGKLPDNVVVCFANTGKEREETLEFVNEFAIRLGVVIHWIEYRPNGEQFKLGATQSERWTEVTYKTASRKGEPFAEVISRMGMPPNPMGRNCTAYLKLKPMDGFMASLGYKDYVRIVGIRSDEPRRIAKMRARDDVTFAMPLVDAGVTKENVAAFWNAMPFDLELPGVNGETASGNCDLCYLKSTQKIIGLIRELPSRADWWAKQEAKTGKLFRQDRPNYAALKIIAQRPGLFDDAPNEESLPCECID